MLSGSTLLRKESGWVCLGGGKTPRPTSPAFPVQASAGTLPSPLPLPPTLTPSDKASSTTSRCRRSSQRIVPLDCPVASRLATRIIGIVPDNTGYNRHPSRRLPLRSVRNLPTPIFAPPISSIRHTGHQFPTLFREPPLCTILYIGVLRISPGNKSARPFGFHHPFATPLLSVSPSITLALPVFNVYFPSPSMSSIPSANNRPSENLSPSEIQVNALKATNDWLRDQLRAEEKRSRELGVEVAKQLARSEALVDLLEKTRMREAELAAENVGRRKQMEELMVRVEELNKGFNEMKAEYDRRTKMWKECSNCLYLGWGVPKTEVKEEGIPKHEVKEEGIPKHEVKQEAPITLSSDSHPIFIPDVPVPQANNPRFAIGHVLSVHEVSMKSVGHPKDIVPRGDRSPSSRYSVGSIALPLQFPCWIVLGGFDVKIDLPEDQSCLSAWGIPPSRATDALAEPSVALVLILTSSMVMS
ncbi:hypothetical protein NMY22_g17200 [Coprinellus aureogranulatus]|nr:hypothetical protein NMY22_g17200 [Coprinellus aureogranulatus]